MAKGTMRVIDKRTMVMQCAVCGGQQSPILGPGGRLPRNYHMCVNGCRNARKSRLGLKA